MLALAGAWLVLLGATVPAGLAILAALRGHDAFDRVGDRLVAAAWIGLLAIGVVLQALSLVAPVTPLAGVLVAAVALAAGLSRAPARADLLRGFAAVTPAIAAGGAVLVAGVAAYIAQRVVWTDTGLYHAGAIRWLSEYGAVPGIGLIHSRFGYSSLWYDLTAPFNDGDARTRMEAVASGFGVLLAAAQLSLVAARALAGRARQADLLALVALAVALAFATWWKQPVAPNPDFPLVILAVVVAWAVYTVRAADTPSGATRLIDARLVPLVIAAGAAAIKLSGVALVVVAGLFYVWPPRLRPARVAVAVASVALVVTPALATGFIQSGCPFYPSGPCADTAWAIEASEAKAEAVAIRSYARRGAAVDDKLLDTDWISPWLRGGQHQFLLLTVLLGAVAALRAPPALRWALATGFAGVALVLYSAPDLRFALGYCGVLLGAFCVRHLRLDRLRAPAIGVAVVLALAGVAFAAARLVRPTASDQGGIAVVTPPRMNEPPLLTPQRTIFGVRYFVVGDAFCWAAPLPCAPGQLRRETGLRDPAEGIDGGFEITRGQLRPQ
jgi:hypothetical protein